MARRRKVASVSQVSHVSQYGRFLSELSANSTTKSADVSFDMTVVEGVAPHNEGILIQLYNCIRKDIEDLQKEFAEDSNNEDIIIANLVVMVTKLMEKVETFNEMKGEEKKAAVLAVTRKILDELSFSPKAKKFINYFSKYVLPSIIDVTVDAASGKMSVNKTWQKIKAKWLLLTTCCKSCCKK